MKQSTLAMSSNSVDSAGLTRGNVLRIEAFAGTNLSTEPAQQATRERIGESIMPNMPGSNSCAFQRTQKRWQSQTLPTSLALQKKHSYLISLFILFEGGGVYREALKLKRMITCPDFIFLWKIEQLQHSMTMKVT
eukprot:6283631-Amphidinium_carterae.1